MINELSALIPNSSMHLSGKAFYSGRSAFSAPSKIYCLGINPAGSAEEMFTDTVENHTDSVLRELPSEWSAYYDESWAGMQPGQSVMQRRVLHLARQLGLNPRSIPSSNIVFERSTRSSTFHGDLLSIAEMTWPFHQRVIQNLGVRVVVCFGGKTGKFVANKLNARISAGCFIEDNQRNWRSFTLLNSEGVAVVTLTPPSVADWTKLKTDPTHLVTHLLNR